jgi:class 3 adenylate cyclase
MALFVPVISGEDHASRATTAGRAITAGRAVLGRAVNIAARLGGLADSLGP